MKAEHYQTVTDFVKANKPEGAAHPREWLSKPGHEFTIEHLSDGTQTWIYLDRNLGVNKVYVDGVLEGAGIPNPTVTAHFESLHPKLKNFDPAIATTAQKGNAGEILVHNDLMIPRTAASDPSRTYDLERIGRSAPASLDTPTTRGIDGIYHNKSGRPHFVIDESKWNTAQLNQVTKTGPQMSNGWVESRLTDLSVTEQRALQVALQSGEVDFVVSRVDVDGTVSHYYAKEIKDSAGKVVKVVAGDPWP